uniref:Reverse transcriptase domain-containing protein n=1 Tax=Syphacia muris TaxID=451379 RepID=A0A0N5ABQ0_9BILA
MISLRDLAKNWFQILFPRPEDIVKDCASVGKAYKKEKPEKFTEAENALQDPRLNGAETAENVPHVKPKDAQPYKGGIKPFNLPIIPLGAFDGDLTGWPAFWSRFERLVHVQEIGEKLAHLQYVLKGSVYDLIKGYTTTAENYSLALKKVKDRYGRMERKKKKGEVWGLSALRGVLQNELEEVEDIQLNETIEKAMDSDETDKKEVERFKLWRKGCDWDEKLPNGRIKMTFWNQVFKKWSSSTKIEVPRYIENSDEKNQLHMFVDTSSTAYTAKLYLSVLKEKLKEVIDFTGLTRQEIILKRGVALQEAIAHFRRKREKDLSDYELRASMIIKETLSLGIYRLREKRSRDFGEMKTVSGEYRDISNYNLIRKNLFIYPGGMK